MCEAENWDEEFGKVLVDPGNPQKRGTGERHGVPKQVIRGEYLLRRWDSCSE